VRSLFVAAEERLARQRTSAAAAAMSGGGLESSADSELVLGMPPGGFPVLVGGESEPCTLNPKPSTLSGLGRW
jgi:hypothetical protein